jgi:mannosyl-3-phosphoglycerate phosphatase
MNPRQRAAVRLRPRTPVRLASARPHRIGVFTAVDATLLDARTFDPGAARAVVRKLTAADIPVVAMSVMTLAEIAPIAADLGLRQPMVIEAGGAIARWNNEGWEVEPCGPPAETFLDVVTAIEDRSGASLLVYSAMEEPAAAQASGRTGEMLHASTHRSFSEPFLIERGDLQSITRAAAELGFSVRRGRRFYHLGRQCDEGEAFTRLREELRCDVAIAVGGSLVDAEFLTRADVAIVVPGPDRTVDAELLARVADARIAPAPAPGGWAVAVEEAVRSVATAKRGGRRAAS